MACTARWRTLLVAVAVATALAVCAPAGATSRRVGAADARGATLAGGPSALRTLPAMDDARASDLLRSRLVEPGGAAFSGDIVGGRRAQADRWPGVASLNVVAAVDGGDDVAGHVCGGTVIAPRWFLTAAHCVTEPTTEGGAPQLVPAHHLEVLTGRLELSSAHGLRHGIDRILVADGWQRGRLDHDLALVALSTPATVPPTPLFGPDNESARPPTQAVMAPDGTVRTAGWGSTVPDADRPRPADHLREVTVALWTQESCVDADHMFDPASSVCAGGASGTQAPVGDACYGDSGGPLMRLDRRSGSYRQLGIVSRAALGMSPDCAVVGQPTIYTRVAAFARTISSVTGLSFPADPAPLPPARVVAGADRYATSAAVSRRGWPDGAAHVTIASGRSPGDALAGAPAAAAGNGPLLLVEPGHVPPVIRDEIARLDPVAVTVLGGPSAVAPAVLTDVAAVTGAKVERVAGATRFDTAAAVSRRVGRPGAPVVYMADGHAYADALAGAAAAVRTDATVLLAPGRARALPTSTAAELTRLRPQRVVVLGGSQVITPTIVDRIRSVTGARVDRLAGRDRYETAVAVADDTAGPAGALYLTGGTAFADALSAGSLVSVDPGPVLLVGVDDLPAAVRAHIRSAAPAAVTVVGGAAAVGDVVLHQFGAGPQR